jgi:hypothetical protein
MKYPIEMATAGIIFLPDIMKMGSGIQVILRLLLQQFEKMWY